MSPLKYGIFIMLCLQAVGPARAGENDFRTTEGVVAVGAGATAAVAATLERNRESTSDTAAELAREMRQRAAGLEKNGSGIRARSIRREADALRALSEDHAHSAKLFRRTRNGALLAGTLAAGAAAYEWLGDFSPAREALSAAYRVIAGEPKPLSVEAQLGANLAEQEASLRKRQLEKHALTPMQREQLDTTIPELRRRIAGLDDLSPGRRIELYARLDERTLQLLIPATRAATSLAAEPYTGLLDPRAYPDRQPFTVAALEELFVKKGLSPARAMPNTSSADDEKIAFPILSHFTGTCAFCLSDSEIQDGYRRQLAQLREMSFAERATAYVNMLRHPSSGANEGSAAALNRQLVAALERVVTGERSPSDPVDADERALLLLSTGDPALIERALGGGKPREESRSEETSKNLSGEDTPREPHGAPSTAEEIR